MKKNKKSGYEWKPIPRGKNHGNGYGIYYRADPAGCFPAGHFEVTTVSKAGASAGTCGN